MVLLVGGLANPRVAMSLNDKVLVTVATYNEMENLPRLIEEIVHFAPHVDILVIDDNSPDGTGRWCEQMRVENPKIFCLHRSGKLGLGTATIAGMKYAIEHGYPFVLNMDADFSHPPKYLPDLLAGMDPPGKPSRDVMIGSRYVSGGGVEGWPLKRQLMSRSVNLYARWMLGLTPKDCSGAFRCYRTAMLAKLDFDEILSRGYSFQEEILWRLKRLGAHFAETPIIFIERQLGVSKIDSGEALAALRIIFKLGLQNLLGR
jgi:dolichol-phosphate mannosyltransferase